MSNNAENILKKVIRKRPLDSHKGDYGRLLLIGGNLSLWWCHHHGSFSGGQ